MHQVEITIYSLAMHESCCRLYNVALLCRKATHKSSLVNTLNMQMIHAYRPKSVDIIMEDQYNFNVI